MKAGEKSMWVIGGVPENVNIPWYEVIDKHDDLIWRDCPGGTGEMFRLLEAGELDIALVLTEGAIAHIAKGSNLRIAGTYVKSPLTWGVHSAPDFAGKAESLNAGRFAVSRMGSGSHLMSYVYASQRDWSTQPEIVVSGGLEGALKAFENHEVDFFLWEKYMTKPFVDGGRLKRIDICRAPWPAFSIAVHSEVLKDLPRLREIVSKVSKQIDELGSTSFIEKVISRYGLIPEDVEEWFSEVEFLCALDVDIPVLESCSEFLLKVGVLEEKFDPRNALAAFLST